MKIPDFSGVFYSPRLACTTWNQEDIADISEKTWHPYKESIATHPANDYSLSNAHPKRKEKKISIFQPSTKPSGDFF